MDRKFKKFPKTLCKISIRIAFWTICTRAKAAFWLCDKVTRIEKNSKRKKISSGRINFEWNYFSTDYYWSAYEQSCRRIYIHFLWLHTNINWKTAFYFDRIGSNLIQILIWIFHRSDMSVRFGIDFLIIKQFNLN